MHTTWTGWKSDPMEIPRCPRCHSALSEGTETCPACNLRFSDISLYDPKHFVWLAMVFSFVVPSLLAAINFGRLGRPDLKKAWLIGGIAGLAVLVLFVRYFGEPFLDELGVTGSDREMATQWGGYLVNLPIAGFLFFRQRALFRGALELGARKASMFKGAVAGIALAFAVGFSSVLAWEVAAPRPGQDVVAMMSEGRFVEANSAIDDMLRDNPDDPELLYRKAMCQTVILMEADRFADALKVADRLLVRRPGDHGVLLCKASCHMVLEEWAEAEQTYRKCVTVAEQKPEIYVFIGFSCEQQGRTEEAQHYYELAEAANPGLVTRLTGRE